jgi:DNA-binding protein HU-beta
MNKATLAQKLTDQLNVSKKSSEDFLEAFQKIIVSALKAGDEVTLAGFGTFSARTRAARRGVHPRDPLKSIDVPTVRVAKFKAGSGLKQALK